MGICIHLFFQKPLVLLLGWTWITESESVKASGFFSALGSMFFCLFSDRSKELGKNFGVVTPPKTNIEREEENVHI